MNCINTTQSIRYLPLRSFGSKLRIKITINKYLKKHRQFVITYLPLPQQNTNKLLEIIFSLQFLLLFGTIGNGVYSKY